MPVLFSDIFTYNSVLYEILQNTFKLLFCTDMENNVVLSRLLYSCLSGFHLTLINIKLNILLRRFFLIFKN